MPSPDRYDDAVVEDGDFVKSPPRQQRPSVQGPSNGAVAPTQEDAERRQREEEESLELARRLMEEEAMASYHQAFDMLRQSAHQLSQDDYDALQEALAEEQHGQVDDLEEEGELSYETMLQLGERIGDVKLERWSLRAKAVIDQLPSFRFEAAAARETGADDSEIKCLVCQCEYDEGELLRRLPCGHCFHADCVDQWLKGKDLCPYCRQSVIESSATT